MTRCNTRNTWEAQQQNLKARNYQIYNQKRTTSKDINNQKHKH